MESLVLLGVCLVLVFVGLALTLRAMRDRQPRRRPDRIMRWAAASYLLGSAAAFTSVALQLRRL
jgi:hypothetical protein